MIEKKYQAEVIANDQEGLALISACMSGSKTKVSDMKYLPSNRIFLLSVERSKIENDGRIINSILKADCVSKVKSKNIDQKKKDLVLELIAIDYLKNKQDFEINLIFKNNAHIALTTEVIDVTLEDQNQIEKK